MCVCGCVRARAHVRVCARNCDTSVKGSRIAVLLIVSWENKRYKPITSYHADSSVVRAFVHVSTSIAGIASEIDTFLTMFHSEALITPQVVCSFRSSVGPMLF